MIGDDGGQLGVMPTYEAMRLAEEKGLDLVEVSPKASPPVCRIMDYGKFKFEQAKKANQARKHASVIEIKEIKFRPKTDDHDFDFKVKHIRRFLQEGNKAKLAVIFRGREIVHSEIGREILNRLAVELGDTVLIESPPRQEGNTMVQILAPKKEVVPAKPTKAAAAKKSDGKKAGEPKKAAPEPKKAASEAKAASAAAKSE